MAEAFKPFLKKSEFISSGDPFTDSILLGASNADMNNVDYGAFKNVVKAEPVTVPVPTATNDGIIKQAQNIADQAYGDSTAGDIDWGVASLLYFSKMAENASKPGATALGAGASAFTQPAAYIMQKDKEKQALEAKKGATVASLIPSLVTANKSKVTSSKDYVVKDAEKFNKVFGTSYKDGDQVPLSQSQFAKAPLGTIIGFQKETSDKAQASKPMIINNVADFKSKLKLGDINPVTDKPWEKGDKVNLNAAQEKELTVGSVSTFVKAETYTDEFNEKRYLTGPNEGKLISEVMEDNKILNSQPISSDILKGNEITSTVPALKKLNKDQFDNAIKFRKEIKDGAKEFIGIQRSFNNIKKFYENPGEISDYSLAVAYAKIIDPGTAAREGEVAAIANSGALAQAVKTQLINALVGGGKLPPNVRAGIFNRSADIYNEEREKTVNLTKNVEKLWETQVGKGQGKWVNLITIDEAHKGYKTVTDDKQVAFIFKENVLNKMNLGSLKKIIEQEKLSDEELNIIGEIIKKKNKKTE